MNKGNQIDAIIDDRSKGYAVAWIEKSHGYAHLNLAIHLPASNEYSYRPDGVIKVTCQMGGDSNDCREKPYAVKWGLETRYTHTPVTVQEVEFVLKHMKKIQRKLDQMNESLGESNEYSELCQRVLIGSGVKDLIVEPNYWSSNTRLPDMKLIRAGSAESMMWFIKAERSMVESFVRYVA